MRGAWIEMIKPKSLLVRGGSHPVRGAWIEIVLYVPVSVGRLVAPREGCVD